MDLFELFGTIVIDNSGANASMADTVQQGQQTQSKMGKAFSSIGKGALAVGKAIGTGLLVAGTAMAGLTVKALNLSGELEQNMGGSEQVFGEYAGKMQETAREAFANMGLSTSDFLATANKMGALFQGAGFSIEESSDLASDAMQRAADVASIMGIDTASAMEAVAGAAKGNFDMMDNLGVAMNEATLNAYALEQGIGKTTAEMTQQEKIALAMEMFMDKTAYATGNYAKENATLAGALGTAKAALTNFLDGSGDVDSLVSAFSNAANVIVDNVTELAPRLISGIVEITNQVIPMIPPLLSEMLPVILEGAVSLINGLVEVLPSLLDMLTTSLLPQALEAIVAIFNSVVMSLPQLVESLVAALPTLIPLIIDALVSMIVTLCENLPMIIQPIIDNLPMIIDSIVTALIDNLPLLLDAGGQLLLGLFEGMLSLVEQIPEILESIFTGIVDGIKVLFGIQSPSTVMADIGTNIMEGLLQGIQNLFDQIGVLWDNVKTTTVNAFNAVKDFIVNIWNTIKTTIQNVLNGIKTTVSNIWNNISTTITNVWTNIKNGVTNAVNTVKTKVSNVFNGIKTTVTNIWNGIKDAITNPIETARDTVQTIIDKIKGFFDFDISWPSIPMPHFGISPSGWRIGDLLQGDIPSLSIDWYAKGGIMQRPTLFDYNPTTGTAKVGGEAGDEAVAPISTLMQYIRTAVAEQNSGVILILERIANLLTEFFPDVLAGMEQTMVLDDGTLVAKMAPAMDVALGRIAIQKGRGR